MSHGHAVPQASALLPCPFCGSNDIERSNSGDPHRTAFWTCCNECGTSTGEGGVYSQDQADARWNRRASQAPAAIAEPNDRERWNADNPGEMCLHTFDDERPSAAIAEPPSTPPHLSPNAMWPFPAKGPEG